MTVVLLLAACVPHLTTKDGAVDDTGPSWAPPENTWAQNVPPDDLEGEGCSRGEVVPEFRLMDQHGDEVSLWQFYGMVVVLDVSTMWCGPCQDLAEEVQATSDDYAEEGLIYITILAQDLAASPPDREELAYWADYYGITDPVVSDDQGWYTCVVPDDSFPGVIVVDRRMRSSGLVPGPTDEQIRAAIEEVL